MRYLHYRRCRTAVSVLALILGMGFTRTVSAAEEAGFPWHVSLTAGWLDFEGDESVSDTFIPSLHLGYDLTESWTMEGIFTVAPSLKENFRNSYGERISRLEENAGQGIHDTRAVALALEGLYHADRTKPIDPYLAVGAGLIRYADDFESQYDPELRFGAGVLWHLSEQVALRADARVMLVGTDPEFNSSFTAGLTWTLPCGKASSGSRAGGVAAAPAAVPAAKPAEVASVAAPVTVPAAGVAENVKKYELHIEFADNSAEITAQYFGELDVIGRDLRDQPGAKAKIEAHVDQRRNSVEQDALQLTEKRAKAVQDYLSTHWKVRKSRTEALGYGFSKPKEKADLDNGNLANRRIEISIISH